MKIRKSIYQKIMRDCLPAPPETGGMIGVNVDGVICQFYFDSGKVSLEKAIYTPNVERWNEVLEKWHADKISFAGVVHTHLSSSPNLSMDDIVMIEKLNALFQDCTLFFPVICNDEITVYKSYYENRTVEIETDSLVVVA